MGNWRSDLETWLAPFVAAPGHKTRGRMCPAYIAGLIGPGDRKSVQPIAARDGAVGHDQLHHFIADGVWDSAPLEAALLAEADRLVGSEGAFLVIDDTCLPKTGERSVGGAPHYASSLKTATCQSLVSATLASREVPVAVGLRLFLPEVWTNDPDRMARARVPDDRQTALSKPEIAIEEIDRVRAAGVRFGCVLADAGYGSSGPFRQALSARGLAWAVGLSRRPNVYPADVGLVFPEARRGRRRKYHLPDRLAVSDEQMLEDKKWRKVSWRRGTKGRLNCQFAATRVHIADGHRHRMADGRVQAMPGDEEVWLIGERRATGARKYDASNLPAEANLKALAAAVKARWICEQAHQQLKEELGLDHFEGRSWTGIHRHALMTMIAHAFLQSRRLKAAGRKKRSPRPPPQPTMPAVRQAVLDAFARPPPRRCPHCERLIAEHPEKILPK